jgi:hypothetical protein
MQQALKEQNIMSANLFHKIVFSWESSTKALYEITEGGAYGFRLIDPAAPEGLGDTRCRYEYQPITDAAEEDWRERCKSKFNLLTDLRGFPRSPAACDECTNEGSCKRIGQCLRFKCAFGEVAKP